MPESFACAVAGTAKRKAVMSIPQALIDFDGIVLGGLNMDASRRLWTDFYAYSLVCPHGRNSFQRFLANRSSEQRQSSRLELAELLERCDCVFCEIHFFIIC